MNIKMNIQYDGTDYSGWQVQKKRKTVQGEIEKRLKRILQEDIKLKGASRTDAGVHALGQTANFIIEGKGVSLRDLQHSLNSMLPEDIVVSGIMKKGKAFNARYDAKSKIYEYRLLNRKYREVLGRNYYWHVWEKLDWGKIKKAAGYLKGKHDFTAFSSTGSPRKNNFCTLKRLDVKKEGSLYKIVLEADFFLYRMARNMVGFLVETGRGRIEPEWVKTVVKKGKIDKIYETAPARGLCLIKVKYGK